MKTFLTDPNGQLSSLRIFFLFWGVLSFFMYFADWLLAWQRIDLMALAAILGTPAIGIAIQHINNKHTDGGHGEHSEGSDGISGNTSIW